MRKTLAFVIVAIGGVVAAMLANGYAPSDLAALGIGIVIGVVLGLPTAILVVMMDGGGEQGVIDVNWRDAESTEVVPWRPQ